MPLNAHEAVSEVQQLLRTWPTIAKYQLETFLLKLHERIDAPDEIRQLDTPFVPLVDMTIAELTIEANRLGVTVPAGPKSEVFDIVLDAIVAEQASMTAAQLHDEAARMGITVSGTKANMLAQLKTARETPASELDAPATGDPVRVAARPTLPGTNTPAATSGPNPNGPAPRVAGRGPVVHAGPRAGAL
jgi:hypothetical protein